MTVRPILLAGAAIVAVGLLVQTGAGAQTAATGPTAPPPAATAPATTTPGMGDPTKGQALFAANCSTCHTDAKVSADSTTLSLFGIVGRKSATNADFSYSPAMTNAAITWTPDKLNAWLENPASVVPGNVMYFPGLPDAGDRANVIAYLSTLK